MSCFKYFALIAFLFTIISSAYAKTPHAAYWGYAGVSGGLGFGEGTIVTNDLASVPSSFITIANPNFKSNQTQNSASSVGAIIGVHVLPFLDIEIDAEYEHTNLSRLFAPNIVTSAGSTSSYVSDVTTVTNFNTLSYDRKSLAVALLGRFDFRISSTPLLPYLKLGSGYEYVISETASATNASPSSLKLAPSPNVLYAQFSPGFEIPIRKWALSVEYEGRYALMGNWLNSSSFYFGNPQDYPGVYTSATLSPAKYMSNVMFGLDRYFASGRRTAAPRNKGAQLKMLLRKRAYRNKTEAMQMQSLSRGLSGAEKSSLYDRYSMSGAGLLAFINTMFVGLGSWGEGDFLGGLMDTGLLIGGLAIMGFSGNSNPNTLDTAQIIGLSVSATGMISGWIRPFIFQSHNNTNLRIALGFRLPT